MNKEDNESLAFIAIIIAIGLLVAFVIKMVTMFFNFIAELFLKLTIACKAFVVSINSFLEPFVSIVLMLSAAILLIGLFAVSIYCIYRYFQTVKQVTDFRKEMNTNESNLRSFARNARDYLEELISKHKNEFNREIKRLNANLDSFKTQSCDMQEQLKKLILAEEERVKAAKALQEVTPPIDPVVAENEELKTQALNNY